MSEYDVLLLNANYEPLNVCNLRRAVSLVLVGKAEVIQDAERLVRSSEAEWSAPSVVRMRYHVRRPMPQLRLSRHSILARDSHTCQYCGSTKDLTIDHVTPRWAGGPSTWDNLVTCCRKCNLKKGDKTPDQARMRLARKPRRPKYVPYLSLQKYVRAVKRDEWTTFLPVFDEFIDQYARN
ncbi:MAG TPA: HNH endonuclease [Fimbriimonadaceae bacterium]|nr:HNH endonuclease [Fimbriimonadaceae bacterium]